MQAVRVILDFPGPDRNRERLAFGPPVRILSTDRLAGVRPVLQEAERTARDGAWVAGFVGYEAAPAFDQALVTRPHSGPLPRLWFGVFDPPSTMAPPTRTSPTAPLDWLVDASRTEYDDAIRHIRNAIAAGAVYQVNHTLRFRAPCTVDPAALHDALVGGRHGRYHALIDTPDWALVSASPELFFDVHDGIITTRPMKGTARRGRWDTEDAAAAAHLAESAKDRAENLMIVDLLRNDLGRIARFGSVHVSNMFAIETYPTVHQMTSTITAALRDDIDLDDIFAAAFPCGSVTGAPKIAAMQHIAGLEHSARGAYCGAIGVLRPDGTATFNVGIRTLVIEKESGTAVYGAGGGITWDSIADAEYDEVIAKAALLDRTGSDFELLETMRLEDGVLRRHELHIARLTASARYWDMPDEAARAAAAALERLVADAPAGAWRVRMTVSRTAHVSITRTPIDATARDTGPAAAGDTGPAARPLTAGGAPPATDRIVAIAQTPVNSRDPLLCHKTTARDTYDRRRAEHPDAYDVLLHNEHGRITEFTTGNVVCEIRGELITPPRDAGLLAGTLRQELIHRGLVREESIALDDLPHVTRMWLVNSVREWVQVSFA
jgi:para-aminobenzoate synthetase/4-amino-4-deoxychorismate lyase